MVRKGFSTGSISWTKFGQDADLPDETLLYAHPSPTPAADADRVREAIRELIDADKELAEAINFAEPTANNNALTTAEYRARAARNQAKEALAALKSEGK